MRVRYAYTPDEISICRRHYEAPPANLPPLGQVLDSRDSSWHHGGCEVCPPRPAEPTPDPDFLAALAADDRSIRYPTHLARRDGRPVLAVGDGRQLTTDEIARVAGERSL